MVVAVDIILVRIILELGVVFIVAIIPEGVQNVLRNDAGNRTAIS